MNQKSILFTKACQAELIEEAVPEPGPGEVLVQMAISTISSGTERANLVGDLNISIAREKPSVAVFPRRSGYSSSGTVAKTGEGVDSLVPGDRVAMSWTSHSQYVCKAERELTKLPDDISFEEAALWHIATFPLAAIRKCRLEIGESTVVMGMGVLGMMAVKLLRAAGASPIIAADPVAEKRELALKIGADYALDPFAPDFVLRVGELTRGGARTAIEVTGKGTALDQVLDCIARFGRVALLGCTRNSDFTIDYYRKVHGPGVTLVGAHTMARPDTESYPGMWTTKDDREAICRLVEGKRLEFASMIGETHAPWEAPEVYTRLATQPAFPLVQFDWRGLK